MKQVVKPNLDKCLLDSCREEGEDNRTDWQKELENQSKKTIMTLVKHKYLLNNKRVPKKIK